MQGEKGHVNVSKRTVLLQIRDYSLSRVGHVYRYQLVDYSENESTVLLVPVSQYVMTFLEQRTRTQGAHRRALN